MINLIPPRDFKTIPWKNTKGQTTQLAINEGGSIEHFDWRISIATVSEDGTFSDFTGYMRHLVLLSNTGMVLRHSDGGIDLLDKALDTARFDGKNKTTAVLAAGEIKDFNVMVNTKRYHSHVVTYTQPQTVKLQPCDLNFIYSPSRRVTLNPVDKSIHQSHIIPYGNLAQINAIEKDEWHAQGENMIIVYLIDSSPL